jgi:iron uptake system EfeUOB component EfeO/EfeM
LVSVTRHKALIGTAAAALIVGVVAVLIVAGPLGASGKPSCSSYPTPGTAAPGGTKVPASLAARYGVLRSPQRAVDRLKAGQLTSLSASGLIMSGTRFLGDAAYGGRIYLVPAEHMLAVRLAPSRCLSQVQRVVEQESLPVLRSQYRQRALCLVLLYGNSVPQNCTPATGTPYALLYASGTPAYGLVPNGVSAVTITYQTAPPRTVPVNRNFFVIVAPSQSAAPCGVQWLAPTGSVDSVPLGCSYLKAQAQELGTYRTYVAGKLSALRSQTAALAAAVASGDVASAKSAWLTAHLTWLEIGQDDGAYGAFGALGGQIDGLAAGHPRGTADPGFTGFHRIEFDLWTKHDLKAAASDTATLRRLLAELMHAPLASYLPATKTGLGNWLLRPHEVLEDALRDSLTTQDDYGSGSDLASISADVSAVRELLGNIGPGLTRLAPGLLPSAESELRALTGAIDATRAGGAWVSVQNLQPRQREQIDADVDAALETLAPIPDVLTSTGSNAPGD